MVVFSTGLVQAAFCMVYCLSINFKLRYFYGLILRRRFPLIFFKNISLLFVGFFLFAAAQSQPFNYSNLRSKKIATTLSHSIDSFSIVPRTFYIKNHDTSFYFLDEVNAKLSWRKKPKTDSVEVIYRVFPYRLNAVSKRFTYDSIMNNFIASPFVFDRNKRPATNTLFDFGTMNYNGSFGRVLSFGNNQDVVVNSQFNLQLSGFIGDSIEVAAAITDNNIPIQPDGTTQQLNEFDRVWLQFKKRNWEVNLGDIDIRQTQTYFLNFYKRLQGVSYANTSQVGKNGFNKLLVSGAIAKGKFTRHIFQGQEGNQGPYRLKGANNELFFIVLANTERVFIDGELLQRGEDRDYVINYNTAEIAFTPRRMITKDTRIQVEFEYADRSYLNSLLYLSNEYVVNKKLKFHVSAYSNVDAKNSAINQVLDPRQKQFLTNLGDSIQNAFFPVASLDTFSAGKILYQKKDTVFNGGRDSIYVYSTDKELAKFSLGFIEVGFGRGNYRPQFNGANGKVYQWVQPVNGIPQGNFEPATFLISPKKQQLLSVGSVYALNATTTLQAEVAASNYNINSFSDKHKLDDKGYASKFLLSKENRLRTNGDKQLRLTSTAGYEFVDRKFRPLERLRNVEFYRDWGLDLLQPPATEHLPSVSLQLSDSANNFLHYRFNGYVRSDDYQGYRQSLVHNHLVKGWQLKNAFNLTNFTTAVNKGYFLRPNIDLSKKFQRFKNYTIGGSYAVERNEVRGLITDTLTRLSFAFSTAAAYIKSDETKPNRWSLTYFTRSDKAPVNRSFEEVDHSQNFNLAAELRKNSKHQFRINVSYRYLNIINQSLTTLKPDNSMLGRVEYAINEWKGFVTGSVLYELGAGQEQRRDFSYIEVPAGRGEFAWNDYNADGIPQINEFEVALFQDQAKYIRVFTPTNQFVKANYTQFNYSLTFNPKALAATISNKKLKDFIARWNLQSSLQTAKKELATGHIVFNPFNEGINDSSLLTLNNVLSNTLSFNRFNQKWGIDVGNTLNFNKALLTYGFESREFKEYNVRGRWNITKQYSFEIIQRVGSNNLFTPKFSNRNYELQTIVTEPRFTFTQGTNYRVLSSYQYKKKQNDKAFGGELSTTNSLNVEGKYNAVNNTSLNGKLTFSNITYTAATNSTISYIMLEGLLPGKNFLWNFDITKRLTNNLELSFQYEGRKPAETRTIHIGRASLRALL